MNIEFNSSGGTSTVTYAINCDGEVRFTSSDNSWLHIEFGNGVLSISADTYNEQSGRTGTITPSVNGTDCPNKVINVTQKKGSQPEPPTPDCTKYEYAASFPGETLELGACATSATLDVTGTRKCVNPYVGEPIDYTPKVSWSKTGDSSITISSTEGTAITVSTTDNCVEDERRANITVTAYTQDDDPIGSITISVTQNGGCDCECTKWDDVVWAVWNGYQYSTHDLIDEVGVCGGNVELRVNGHYRCATSTDPYTPYTPKADWKIVEGGNYARIISGHGTSEITVSIEANETAMERQVKLQFTGYCHNDESAPARYGYPDVGNEVIIKQAAGPCEEPATCSCESITVTPISNKLSNEGKNGVALANIEINDPDCTGRFSLSGSDFISNVRINGTSIVGNVSENATDSERTATISVKFDSTTCTSFTVTQEAKPAEECPEYEITVTPEQLTCEGGYVKFGAKLNGTDVSGVENWTWECIGYTEGGSEPGDGRTNNELDINANDESYDITYTFKYTDSNGCTGTTTCSIAACDEEECEFAGKYGTVTGNCFCDGLTYDVWLTCNGNEIQGTRKRVTTIWDEENYGDWWDYGYASNSITKKDIISYDGDEYVVNVPLTSECYVRRVVVELYAEQDDIAGGTINFNEVSTINTMINGHGFDIGGLQQGDLSDASSVSWNPTDQITVCDDGNTDYGLNIEFPATFYDVSIGERNYTFTRNAVGKWACVKDETYDYIVLTPTIVVGRHGELIIRIRVQEGASL